MHRAVLVLLALLALTTTWAMWPSDLEPTTPQRAQPATPNRTTAPVTLPTDPVLGPPDAEHTIIEYGDFRCPACADAASMLAELRVAYGEGLRIVWKDFPHLDGIAGSKRLHIAARCAQDQGRFWEFHDAIFAARGAMTDADLLALADALRLDRATFDTCRASSRARALVDANERDARRNGVDGTPTFFVDGTLLTALPTISAFTDLLDVP